MMNLIRLFIICALVTLTGCDQLSGMTNFKSKKHQQNTAAVNPNAVSAASPIEDVQLAQIILKPKRHKLTITRDPFEPLIKSKGSDGIGRSIEQLKEADALKGMQYLGMVKVGEDTSALIKTQDKKEVYKVNDQVNHLTITAIEEDVITFTQGSKTFKLKRGVL